MPRVARGRRSANPSQALSFKQGGSTATAAEFQGKWAAAPQERSHMDDEEEVSCDDSDTANARIKAAQGRSGGKALATFLRRS